MTYRTLARRRLFWLALVLLLGLLLAVLRPWNQRSEAPRDDLGIDPGSIVTVDLIQPDEALRFRRENAEARFATPDTKPADDAGLRALIAGLTTLDPGRRVSGADINWAAARYVQLGTKDGLLISAQVVPAEKGGAWMRINADALPGADKAVAARATEIKALRTQAFRLSDAEAALLLKPLQAERAAP